MLKKFAERVRSALSSVAGYQAIIDLCERRIHAWKARLEAEEKHGGLETEAETRARAKLSYWRIRKTKAERFQKHWRDIVRRRVRQKKRWIENHPDNFPKGEGGDWVIFDGHEVARWMAVVLQAARDSGMWTGVVFSGRRTKQFSQELCEGICGAPSCPGRCAGLTSNHVGPPTYEGVKWEGAADVTDPFGLRHYCETHNAPLHGGGEVLPADIAHFSHEGN